MKHRTLKERIEKLYESGYVNEFNYLENQLQEARYLVTILHKQTEEKDKEIERLNEMLEKNFYEKYPFIIENGIICKKNQEIEILKEEVNKQAKIIKCYEKENRQNQKTIINLSKRIDKTNQAIDELLFYDDFKDITNASFGNVKEALQFYLSQYDDIEEFRKHKGE